MVSKWHSQSLTAAASGAIKSAVLLLSHHQVTCLHRLVPVLSMEIYSRGQRAAACGAVDMHVGGETD